MFSSGVVLRRGPRALPKAKLAPKKHHGHHLMVCCLSDPLQLPESSRNHYISEACSGNWWDAPKTEMPAATIGQQKGPSSSSNNAWLHIAQPVLQKLNELGCQVLPHLPYLPDLSPTDYHFFKHLDNFLQGKCFYNQQDAENAFQEFSESQSTDHYATRINKLISHWQKYVDCYGSCFD